MFSAFSVVAVLAAATIMAIFWWRKLSMVQAIVLANFAVYILMVAAGQYYRSPFFGTIIGTPFLDDLAFRPADVAANPANILKVVTATFLHFDFVHVFGNMLVLIMIGLAFEDRIGRTRFLALYMLTAITAVLLHVVYGALVEGRASLGIALVGASGAVFGILGAFATMYPRDQIPMFLIFIFLPRVPVMVGALILMLFEGFLLFVAPMGSVARAAHLGGAVGGALLAPLFRPPDAKGARQAMPVDLDALAARVTTPLQHTYVQRLRENIDEPETAAAWLERLAPTMECRTCGRALSHARGFILRCPDGHQERYEKGK